MTFDVKGWCPGALRPMLAGDGLVVRLRLPMGRMTPAQARGIAQAARVHGNGQLHLSNRANLQLRGVRDDTHRALLGDLAALGVLDRDLALESRRNILLSPFSQPGDGADDLALALQARLMDVPDLPAKFGHVVDIGPARVLADISGDLRLERGQHGGLILRADGADLGQPVTPGTAIAALIDLAHWFVAAGGMQDGRGRMRALMSRGTRPAGATIPPVAAASPPGPGPGPHGLLAAFEFGAFSADALIRLADLGHDLRLTPWRMILIHGLSDPDALRAVPGLITDPTSALLALRACPGAPFCPQALAPVRDLARALAPQVPRGQVLHVSGCAKGCAHPQAADLTLVAAPGGFAFGRNCAANAVSGAVMTQSALLQSFNLFAPDKAV